MQRSFGPPACALIYSEPMRALCRHMQFEPGALLRKKGQHYREMYLIDDGSVEVDFEAPGTPSKMLVSGLGSPIGEIGFLRGCAATATVTARTPTGVLVIDDPTLARLERDAPALTAQLLRELAETAQERTSYNLTFDSTVPAYGKAPEIEVLLCRNEDMLEGAKRLRYDVYCRELQRRSPYADHEKQIITDDLDNFGYTFVAIEAGEVIGTLRGNASREGPLGVLEELYGMTASAHHPEATCVCTKFIVKKSKRGGPASIKLISALARFGVQNLIKECYIDCIPVLLPYYKAMGFAVTGEKFLHRENGPSYPMKLDLAKDGAKLCEERGLREEIKLYVKAQAIKLVDHARKRAARALSRRESGKP